MGRIAVWLWINVGVCRGAAERYLRTKGKRTVFRDSCGCEVVGWPVLTDHARRGKET